MNTPIIIPIVHNNEPDRCPSCGELEDIKQVCKHCGHEYIEEENTPVFTIVTLIILLIIGIYILCTICEWFVWADQKSLLDVVVGHWEFIKSLRIK
jgi:hypothetical protein